MKKQLFLLYFTVGLTYCASVAPHKDFIIAETALSRAKKSQGDKLYPDIYARANRFYKKAISFFNQENYEKSQTYFQESIKWAEKAELKSRLKQAREEEF